jgi:hypothetical protein
MKEDRVAEIYFEPAKSFGSGYLVAPDLVLSARHAVASDLEALPATRSCEVRLLGDYLAGRETWRPGEVVWPPNDEWVAHSTPDIALVAIDADGASKELAQGNLDWGAPKDHETLDCRALGFPKGRAYDRDKRVWCDPWIGHAKLMRLMTHSKGSKASSRTFSNSPRRRWRTRSPVWRRT